MRPCTNELGIQSATRSVSWVYKVLKYVFNSSTAKSFETNVKPTSTMCTFLNWSFQFVMRESEVVWHYRFIIEYNCRSKGFTWLRYHRTCHLVKWICQLEPWKCISFGLAQWCEFLGIAKICAPLQSGYRCRGMSMFHETIMWKELFMQFKNRGRINPWSRMVPRKRNVHRVRTLCWLRLLCLLDLRWRFSWKWRFKLQTLRWKTTSVCVNSLCGNFLRQLPKFSWVT